MGTWTSGALHADRPGVWWEPRLLGSRLLEQYDEADTPQGEPVASRDVLLEGIAPLGQR
jgi:hypothetical protein